MKRCIQFICNKLSNSQSSDSNQRIAFNPDNCVERFSILIIETKKNSNDILCDKYGEQIYFTQNPYDVVIRYVLIYEAGTYEIFIRDMSKICFKVKTEIYPLQVEPEECVSLGDILVLLCVFTSLASLLVYHVYVNPIFEKVRPRSHEVDVPQTLDNNLNSGNVSRSFSESISKFATSISKFGPKLWNFW